MVFLALAIYLGIEYEQSSLAGVLPFQEDTQVLGFHISFLLRLVVEHTVRYHGHQGHPWTRHK